jgi:hypothetical protein
MASMSDPPMNLVDASEHLLYEIEMFVGTANLLMSTQPDSIITNALLESYAIHARALTDFFYPPRTYKKNDVIAENYVPDWRDKRPSMSKTLSDARDRTNTEIAHLTFHRVSVIGQAKCWSDPGLANEIMTLCGSFLRLVKASDLCPKLLQYKNQPLAPVMVGRWPVGSTSSLGPDYNA